MGGRVLDRVLIWVVGHARLIPECVLRRMFMLAADCAWLLRVGGEAQLERNLAHVLASGHGRQTAGSATSVGRMGGGSDEASDRRAVRRLARAGMRSYFSYFSEALSVGARGNATLRARIRGTGDGLEQLRHVVRDSRRSAPIAMGHQGNWDYAGFWGGSAVAPVTTVAERLDDKELLAAFVAIRERLGMHVLLTGTEGLTDRLVEVLRRPECALVPLLADRDLSRRGVFVRAFDSVIRVAAGPAVLALETGLPLFVVNMHRERLSGKRRRLAASPVGYLCEVSGPIDVEPYRSMSRPRAVRELTQAWVDVWARGIAAHPEDWHMLQPIFVEDLDMDRLSDVPDWVLAARMSGMALRVK